MLETEKGKFPGLARRNPTVLPDPNLYRRIGRRISEARADRRMTQDELGQIIGETGLTISRWETASRKPNVEDVVKLAEALSHDLLFFTEESPPAEEPALQLNRAIGSLDSGDQKELLAIAQIKLERKREYLSSQLDLVETMVDTRSSALAHAYEESAKEIAQDPLFDLETDHGMDLNGGEKW